MVSRGLTVNYNPMVSTNIGLADQHRHLLLDLPDGTRPTYDRSVTMLKMAVTQQWYGTSGISHSISHYAAQSRPYMSAHVVHKRVWGCTAKTMRWQTALKQSMHEHVTAASCTLSLAHSTWTITQPA